MASRFWVGNGGTWDASDTTHWAATSGGAGGQSVPGSGDTVTIDGSSGTGTVTVNTDFTVTSISCGAMGMTLDFATNNNSPTMGSFNCSGTGTRVVNMGSGIWTLTGSGLSILNFSTSTNLTLNTNSSVVNCTYSGATGTRTLATGGITVNNINVTAGTDTLSLTSTFRGNNLRFSGFTGTGSLGSCNISGNLTLGAGMTINSSASGWTFNATTSKTITNNGVQNNQIGRA